MEFKGAKATELIEQFESKAFSAVSHVAAANYQSREIEAKDSIRSKCDSLYVKAKEIDEQRSELIKALQDVRNWYEENREELLPGITPICFSKALTIIDKTLK